MMTRYMRQPTLETLGLGTVLNIFEKGKLPANTSDLVDHVFGPQGKRNSLVISGANGIVGAGKLMQFASRLEAYGVPIVALDLPSVSDGIGPHYGQLANSFGAAKASKILANIVRLSYDGINLPAKLKEMRPCFVIEAIPEILDLKRNHYQMFRSSFKEIEIRSVTSGFPSSKLGVPIAHPAFPHHINKVWEVVENEPSAITKLFWSLGLIPVPVSDHWSFVLDVLFCGLTLSALKYHEISNMPFWKIDKFVRKHLGANPFRAHDSIGAKGANFLTWSCLHHLCKEYGDLFAPSSELNARKGSDQNWYPMDHFRPLVNWSMSEEEEERFKTHIYGPMIQMTALMLDEKRAHLSHMNSIGELCAQFQSGILAVIRKLGADNSIKVVNDYHELYPHLKKNWRPAVFEKMDSMQWKQLYVNAEHDGHIGVISIGRESYNHDVNLELNGAIDWLKQGGIEKVILTSDFHLSSQLVGADTSDFFAALNNYEVGYNICIDWSKTARRLAEEFTISVGFINGKRCLGGLLELMTHCHYVLAHDGAVLGMPEVTLPIVPGMEGCHWSFRKTDQKYWPNLFDSLLSGKMQKAKDTINYFVDYTAPMEEAIRMVYKIVSNKDHNLSKRKLETGSLNEMAKRISDYSANIPIGASENQIKARKAILDCIEESCGSTLPEALIVQSKHSANFMLSKLCHKGQIGMAQKKNMQV